MKKTIFTCIALLCSILLSAQNISYYNGKEIETGKIIYKYKSVPLKSTQQPTIEKDKETVTTYLLSIGAKNIQQKFPKTIMPENCPQCVDISQIYQCTYDGTIPLEKVISNLNKMDGIEYAEPSYIGELLFTPNDTEYTNGNLWHLNTCKILDAWDIETGDSSVVIGIVDGGIDIIQPDLINKIAYNVNDPIDGVDNDGDGYTDNYRGWDVADEDNNPSNTSATEHGTYVAGIASAEVNNSFGTAGVGYKTKFLPIKVCQEGSASVVNGYDGIVYAANMGCKVINCSWGDNAGSNVGQDIIDYVTYNCDALVVAAAGNSASTELYYPASYTNVLSVGGTIAGDYAWDETTKGTHYNQFVDICAPAKGFYSIANNEKTIAMSGGGTSFSSPIVSGAAALLRSKYPTMSAIQIGEQLRVTADDIYELNDEKFKDKLGNGRLNVYNALIKTNLPSIRIVDIEIENKHIYADDSVQIIVTFKNYLANATNVSIVASCETFLTIENDTIVIPNVKAGETFSETFTFYASAEPLAGFETYLKFVFDADNNYHSYEYYPIILNPDYYDFELCDIATTATRDGSIAVYSINESQNGFDYKGYGSCIYQGGIVLAENQNTMYSSSYWARDFTENQFPTEIDVDTCDKLIYSDFYVENINIQQYLYGWEDTSAIVYEYRIENQRDSAIYDTRFAMFIDWDVVSSAYDKIWYVDSLQLTAVTCAIPNSYYVGLVQLDQNESGLYAFNVDQDVIYYNDGFNNNELWYILNNQQTTAGLDAPTGAEIAAFNYVQIDTIAPNDTIVVRYAMIAADTQEDLYNIAYQLRKKYIPPIEQEEDTITEIKSTQIEGVKLCHAENRYWLEFPQQSGNTTITICNANGQIEKTETIQTDANSYIIDIHSIGIHFISISNGKECKTFVINK